MATRDNVEQANGISAVGCYACPCGQIHIRLHDKADEVFAVASMPPAVARRFYQQLGAHLAQAEKTGLSAIRCEGSA